MMDTPRLLVAIARRNVRRNLRRSLLTAASILLCTALLILGFSWLNGVLGSIVGEFIALTGPVRVVDARYAAKERLLPLHLALHDAAALGRDLARFAPGGAFPRITFPAMLIKGESDNAAGIGRAIVAADAPNLELGKRIYAGRVLQEGRDEIVVGKLLADELGLRVGDEVTLLGKGASDSIAAGNFTVAGLSDAGSSMLNRAFYVDLTVAQRLLDMEDQATEVALFGRPLIFGGIPPGLAELLEGRSTGETRLVAQHWLVSGGFASAFAILKYVIGGIACIVLFVAALGVLNTMMMAVMERRKEIGVLLAQGTPLTFVVAMIVLEALVLGFAGSAGGAVLGSIAGYALEVHGVNLGEAATRSLPVPVKDVLHADWNLTIVAAGFLMGMLVSLAGALAPAVRAVRMDPARSLRIDA